MLRIVIYLMLSLGLDARAADIRCDADVNHDLYLSALWRDPSEALRPHDDILPNTKFISSSSCSIAYLSGLITAGDFEKVRKFLYQNHPFLRGVRLNSPGGDVAEAIKIGRLLRKYLVAVWAPNYFPDDEVPSLLTITPEGKLAYLCKGQTCTCSSACALIWFGGIERYGRVGLHRPRPSDLASFGELSPEDASKLYIRQTSEIRSYLSEVEAPVNAIETILTTSSSEIRWINNEGVERAPSFAEWQDAACGHSIKQPNYLVSSLAYKKYGQGFTLSSEEEEVLHEYETKSLQQRICLEKQRYRAVDRLPAP